MTLNRDQVAALLQEEMACRKCGKGPAETEFYREGSLLHATRVCRPCHRAAVKAHHADNPQQQKAREAKWRAGVKGKQAQYRKNAEKRAATMLKGIRFPWDHTPDSTPTQRRRLHQALKRSAARGREFDLWSYAHVKRSNDGCCLCCGVPYWGDRHPTIDCIDPARGYVQGNVAEICGPCNRRKQDSNVQQLSAILAYIKRHNV